MQLNRTVAAVLVTVLSAIPASTRALTEDEIDALIEQGQKASSVREAPAFFVAGKKFPKGSFGRSVMLGTSEPPYVFLIRSCRQWVVNYAFTSTMNNSEVNRDAIDQSCLNWDGIRVAVVSAAGANEVVGGAMGYLPIPGQPITALALEIDGELVTPEAGIDFNAFGDGNATALFDPSYLRGAESVSIVATINSEYRLEQRVKTSILKDLSLGPEPEPSATTNP